MSQQLFNMESQLKTLELSDIRGPKPLAHVYDHSLSHDLGKGLIRFLKLDLGFRVVEIDAHFSSNIELRLYDSDSFLYFIYVNEGIVYHKFEDQNKIAHVEELSPAIVGSHKSSTNVLYLKNNRPVKLNMVCIDKEAFFKAHHPSPNLITTKTDDLLKSLNMLHDYLYLCSSNLNLSEKLRGIRTLERSEEFLDLLDLKSQYQMVLGIYLNQFYQELYVKRVKSTLSNQELQHVRKLTEYIVDNPEVQHTIKKLCFQSTLSPAKLQEGFKSMHGTTVSDFIRNVRLDKAKMLFSTTDYNVSEVVYMIGITSRSYFCKIFKKRFGISPSVYRNEHKDDISLNDLVTIEDNNS
ncbi:AraC family transcriptional regulator [Winogradskyella maritima]|uniref:Helix-turn-helix transcriptional regulator n=1 Tax=Winogradskyella maritima TaxID=1517766 RepID=A0ABV8AMQ2_9FLAO|nr:AraC family transcriptional regulator [Winogradskyella maritima]